MAAGKTDTGTTTDTTADTAAWPFGPMTDAELTDYMDATLSEHAPRRFAVFGVAPDRGDAGVIGWGLAFADEALLWIGENEDGRPSYFQYTSAESIRDLFARRGEVRLGWADSGAGEARTAALDPAEPDAR